MFHVPEQYRLATGPMGSDSSLGNNGAFIIPSPFSARHTRRHLIVIASDGPELWQPVSGYFGLYEISTKGIAVALDRDVPLPNGGFRHQTKRILEPEVMDKGYLRVALSKDGETRKILVHDLVAKAFIPNPHGYPEINHIDGCKSNNCAWNLEWCTTAYNRHHAIESGLASGFTTTEIDEIKLLFAQGVSSTQIAEQFRKSRQTINDIKAGRHHNLPNEKPSKYTGDVAWEHVSIHAEQGSQQFTPHWDEMAYIKDMFWSPEDVVMQLHPARDAYVNLHANTLHLWRPIGVEIPTPPIKLV